VFSGHDSQWSGMGRDLLADEPAFAKVIRELEPVFHREVAFSPRDKFDGGRIDGVDRAHPMLFAVQIGLAAVWRSYGVRPAAVIGHSMGEIAAAVVAGALSLVDGARPVCRQALLLRRIAGAGAMVSVPLTGEELQRRLDAVSSPATLAIYASPAENVVVGDADEIDRLVTAWRAEGLAVRRVNCGISSHNPGIGPLAAELAAAVFHHRAVTTSGDVLLDDVG
jgi:6-methylsalicylic acid synthase